MPKTKQASEIGASAQPRETFAKIRELVTDEKHARTTPLIRIRSLNRCLTDTIRRLQVKIKQQPATEPSLNAANTINLVIVFPVSYSTSTETSFPSKVTKGSVTP